MHAVQYRSYSDSRSATVSVSWSVSVPNSRSPFSETPSPRLALPRSFHYYFRDCHVVEYAGISDTMGTDVVRFVLDKHNESIYLPQNTEPFEVCIADVSESLGDYFSVCKRLGFRILDHEPFYTVVSPSCPRRIQYGGIVITFAVSIALYNRFAILV